MPSLCPAESSPQASNGRYANRYRLKAGNRFPFPTLPHLGPIPTGTKISALFHVPNQSKSFTGSLFPRVSEPPSDDEPGELPSSVGSQRSNYSNPSAVVSWP